MDKLDRMNETIELHPGEEDVWTKEDLAGDKIETEADNKKFHAK